MTIFRFTLKGFNSFLAFCHISAIRLKSCALLLILSLSIHQLLSADQLGKKSERESTKLPEPEVTGEMSVQEALQRCRSVRNYSADVLTLGEVSQLLWACAGKKVDSVTQATRTAPSAGGLYPLETYLVAARIDGLEKGIYAYSGNDHTLRLLEKGDFRTQLVHAAGGQLFIKDAPATIIITADYQRTEVVYGNRGKVRYVPMDAGHAAQNVYLQAASLGLGTVAVGAFFDREVEALLDLKNQKPLYIMPVGRPRF